MSGPLHIRDLGVIGDRRTAALVSSAGDVVWYCPGRFDAGPLLRRLIDPGAGGAWGLAGDVRPVRRAYLEDSGVLETAVLTPAGEVTLVDFMPLGPGQPRGLCRFVRADGGATLVLTLPEDGAPPSVEAGAVRLDTGGWLSASHPLEVDGRSVRLRVPAGASGWVFLGDDPPGSEQPEVWLEGTLDAWRQLAQEARYEGPYEDAVRASLRALRLLTFGDTGSVVSAVTTSLPEVLGGERNYDYSYVWFRDSGMIVRALSRLTTKGTLGRGFVDFVCRYAAGPGAEHPLPPLATVLGHPAPEVTERPYQGFAGSRPVRFGNAANTQLQLDVYGNILLAGAQLYGGGEIAEHWHVLEPTADYLCDHWAEPDNGIWEEEARLPYVSSKVLGAVGLEALARLHPSEAVRSRWTSAAHDMRSWVSRHGLTSEGAFAAVAGEEAVDVVSALYAAWGYCAPDAPEMQATLRALEREHARDGLYWRTLREPGTGEGAFLAGTLWVALYWTARDPAKARELLDTVLSYANDLGLLSEEADPATGELLGNFPQTFVHSALIGVVAELRGKTFESAAASKEPGTMPSSEHP